MTPNPPPPAPEKCHCGLNIKGEGQYRHCPVGHFPERPATPEQPGLLTPEQLREIKRRLRQVTRNYTTTGTATPDPVDTLIDEDIPALLRHISTQDAKLATQDQWMREAREALKRLRLLVVDPSYDPEVDCVCVACGYYEDAHDDAKCPVAKLLSRFPHPHDGK